MTSPAAGDALRDPIQPETEPPARVVANSAWMMLAQGVVAVTTGAVTIYAIRSFSASSWGHYSTAIALVAVFGILSGLGLAPLTLREMAAAPARENEILGESLQSLVWSASLAAIALIATTAILGYPHEVVVLVLVLLPLLFLDPAVANLVSAFNARFRLDYVARFQIAQAVAYGVLAMIVIASAFGIAGLAISTIAASVLALCLALYFLRSKLALRPRLRHPPREAFTFLRAAAPIAGINLVAVVYARIDVVMLSVLSTSRKVAFYTVPYSLVRLSWVLPSVVATAFFPLLSRTLKSDRSEAEQLFFLVVRVFLFLSVPISLVLAVGSPTLLPLVFGDVYSNSVPVLQIMAWTSVFGFQNYVLWYGVLAAHKERAALVIQIVGLGVNVAINAFAIPLYGPTGAATALVVSDLVVVAGQAMIIHRSLFRVPVTKLLKKPGLAAVVTVPPAALLGTRTALGGALLGAFAYVLILQSLRYVTSEEWRPVIAVAKAPLTLLRGRAERPA